jgi:hypothetical protein
MNCSAQEIVDAIITAAVQRGSDGRGKDGLDGRMFMLARTHRESFGNLLVAALRLKMKAKPEYGAVGKEFLTEEEFRAELRESGLPEGIIKYVRPYDARNLPAKLLKDAQPNGTRQVMEATINAAIRHGSDGHGKDGMVGYMLVLERTAPKTFNRLMEMAQQWQAATTTTTNKVPTYRTKEEMEAGLRGVRFSPLDYSIFGFSPIQPKSAAATFQGNRSRKCVFRADALVKMIAIRWNG